MSAKVIPYSDVFCRLKLVLLVKGEKAQEPKGFY